MDCEIHLVGCDSIKKWNRMEKYKKVLPMVIFFVKLDLVIYTYIFMNVCTGSLCNSSYSGICLKSHCLITEQI